MSKDTFNRKEIKYRLTADQLRSIRAMVSAHLPQGEFGCGRVSSIYLDTLERTIIARSMEKPLYKEKLRVRWYGAQHLEDASAVFIELKKKFKGIVHKRRLQVTPDQANAFLHGETCMSICTQEAVGLPMASSYQRHQIAHEIDDARERAGNVRPSALIACVRTSFGSDDEGALRITFDERLRALGMLEGECSLPLLGNRGAIMEVKCLDAYPSWLVDALSRAQAYPSSFSKYGAFYEATQKAKQWSMRTKGEMSHA